MITLMLPTPLTAFIKDSGDRRPRSLHLNAGTWAEFLGEMRERFPSLAERVLTASGTLASGFVLVINDEALPANGRDRYDLHDGDHVALIAALAGG